MKLLVVVDKLLTGFDAPHCTYLYVDKSMQDHGLFQAICRTNRIDGEDKQFGYIVDYKDLFKKLVNDKGTGALQVYSSELDHSAGGAAPEVLMQDRLAKGRERLETAMEAVFLLCEPVEPPKGELEHIHYFCGNSEIPSDLKDREPQRAALYKETATFMRAYANLADEMERAGYDVADVARIKDRLQGALNVREIVRKASGESLDLKAYEADMRHLIDTYIEAKEPRKVSPFDNLGLLELIATTGIGAAIDSRLADVKKDRAAVAETIENNVRKMILKEHLSDPAFYTQMSALLDEIIATRKAKAIEYEEYLRRVAELAKKVNAGRADDTPAALDTPGKRALYNNLRVGQASQAAEIDQGGATVRSGDDATLALALRIDRAVKDERPDAWRDVQAKEMVIKRALYDVLGDEADVERIFAIVKAQREY